MKVLGVNEDKTGWIVEFAGETFVISSNGAAVKTSVAGAAKFADFSPPSQGDSLPGKVFVEKAVSRLE